MDARSILYRLRLGEELSADELNWFAGGLASGAVSDAQAGAFAMAAVSKGLGPMGRVALTRAMRDSGDVLSWDLDGPVLDKHSTGGVGDCVSLILAPALAACGAYVPMISGRGLGHTGGTLDKLEAIPGLSTEVDDAGLRAITSDVGCAIVSASKRIAPADRRLYAIRDVTATVESIDLITASILSKKLAAGLQGLVLDVKVGSGAFMTDLKAATELASALVGTSNGAGCPTAALITDMNQPVVPAIGNAVEIRAVMEVLTRGAGTSRIEALVVELGGTLLAQSGLAGGVTHGRDMILKSLVTRQAAERFGRMVAALGGPKDFVEKWRTYQPEAPVILEVHAGQAGVVTEIDCRILGEIVVLLGGGRQVEGDQIDPSVGITHICPPGTRVIKRDPIATIHATTEEAATAAADVVRAAIKLGDEAPKADPLVHKRLA